MSNFQIVSLSFLAIFTIIQLRAIKKGSLLKNLYALRWLFLSLAGGTVIAFPSVSTGIARLLGIERGVDIIIYISIIWLFYKTYLQENEIETLKEKLEAVVRELALKNERKKN